MAASLDILVVEDDPLVQMNYLDMLGDAGFNAVGASSLSQGLRQIAARRFNLIVCDHDLGDGKGLTLVSWLANDADPVPVIYLTAAIAAVRREAAGMTPVKQVLSKPVTPEQLLAAVRNQCSPQTDGAHYPSNVSIEERELLFQIFNREEPQK